LITSLWLVDDAATSILMEELYAHLWQQKLPPLEALRRAQLAVLDHPDRVLKRNQELAAERPRGMEMTTARIPTGGQSRRRSPPQWWAAFVLSAGIGGPAVGQGSDAIEHP
jgi:CHAT domain-containing protein